MRRRTVVVPLLLLAGALIAWRHRRARAGNPSLAGPSTRPPAPPLESAERFVSVPWTLTEAPPEQAELTLRCACAEQMELDRVDAQETPTQVFVTVLMRWRPPAGGHVAWGREHQATVALSAPLGSRALVHAPVDLDAPADDDPGSPPLYP